MITPAPGVGQEVGGYRLDEQLGEGGMGVVYRATHAILGKKAAVKLMRVQLCTDTESVRRFFNEAVLTASIRHPGIVEIYDYGVHVSGSAYIAMALLDGESLEDRLRSRGALPLLEALRISRQIAGALEAAHRAGVVHRDLKPDNVFLTVDPDIPGGERIQLLDFGIAKLLGNEDGSAALTQTGTVLGTPLYMSPEQCRGRSNLDGRTDLYALGCMLYQMLAGRPPFTGESALEVGAAHVRDEPDPITRLCPGIPPTLAALVHRLLEKKPENRPPGAALVAARLSDLIATIETSPLAARGQRIASVPFPLSESAKSLELAQTAFAADDASTFKRVAEPASRPSRFASRRARLVLAAALALTLGVGATLWSLAPAADRSLVVAAPSGCPTDTATCRRFADLLRRGDGIGADRQRAHALVADACAKGDKIACLDEIVSERRAAIPISKLPSMGTASSPVDLVLAIDYEGARVDEWIDRFADIESAHRGDARVHVVGLAETARSEILAEMACIYTTAQAYNVFLNMREALLAGAIDHVFTAAQVGDGTGLRPELVEIFKKDCHLAVPRQADALVRHHARMGTVFVAGKRLDPPYSDEAVATLIRETIELRQTREGGFGVTADRVSSSGRRFGTLWPPPSGPDVSLLRFCDPSRWTCFGTLIVQKNAASMFGTRLEVELRPLDLERDGRAVAGCVLERLGLIEEFQKRQLAVPSVDRRRPPLSPAAMYAIADGVEKDELARLRDEDCPEAIRAAHADLLRLTGTLEEVAFVNGRPAPVGSISEIKAMIIEELALRDKLDLPGPELESLLLSQDSQKPFSTRAIEPPTNLR